MNKLIYSVILLCSVITLLSCEPASYSREGTTHRLVTVRYDNIDDKAKLVYDPTSTSETYSASLDNFSIKADMDRFKLKDGDRGIAQISYKDIPADNIFSTVLDSFIVIKPNELNWNGYLQDTLGTYIHFNAMYLGDVAYEGVWNNGHIACAVITYYPDPETPEDKNKMDMYLHGFRNDTLSLLVTATIPNSDYFYGGRSGLLQYDLSTLRTSNSKTAREIIGLMDEALTAETDSFYLEITTCDSLKFTNRGNSSIIVGRKMYTKVPFDF